MRFRVTADCRLTAELKFCNKKLNQFGLFLDKINN